MKEVALHFLAFGYFLSLFAGTAYLVQVHNWSPWWFAFAILVSNVKVKLT